MFPASSCKDKADCALRRVMLPCQRTLTNATCLVNAPNLNHLIICKSCVAIAVATAMAILLFAVRHVNGICSKKQMLRTNTTTICSVPNWIEAVAIVTNEQAIRNGTISKLVREAMGEHLFIANPDSTVTLFSERSGPKPAPFNLFHLTPKTLFQWTGLANNSEYATPRVVTGMAAKLRLFTTAETPAAPLTGFTHLVGPYYA